MKIAVIPARGGSKRIPKKNIKAFRGKPIIAWSIEAALTSGCFDQVVVSTDHEEIASVAEQFGAKVPFIRPSELSDDFTGTNMVVKHAIQWYQSNNKIVDYACCIYATAPFITAKVLQYGFTQLIIEEKKFSFSVTSFSFPIQRALKISDAKISMFQPEHLMTRSQDLTEAYHDAGQFYWGQAQAFIDNLPMFSEHSTAIILPRYRVQDIDTLEDWRRAELMHKALEHRAEEALELLDLKEK